MLFQEAFPSSPFCCCSNSYSCGAVGNGESWGHGVRFTFEISPIRCPLQKGAAWHRTSTMLWTREASREQLCFPGGEYPTNAVVPLYQPGDKRGNEPFQWDEQVNLDMSEKIRSDKFSSEMRTAVENVLCSNQGQDGAGKTTVHQGSGGGGNTSLGCRRQWGFQSYFLADLLICLWHVPLRSHNFQSSSSALDALGFLLGCSWTAFLWASVSLSFLFSFLLELPAIVSSAQLGVISPFLWQGCTGFSFIPQEYFV